MFVAYYTVLKLLELTISERYLPDKRLAYVIQNQTTAYIVFWSIPGLDHQLCWDDWEMATTLLCKKGSQVAGLSNKSIIAVLLMSKIIAMICSNCHVWHFTQYIGTDIHFELL